MPKKLIKKNKSISKNPLPRTTVAYPKKSEIRLKKIITLIFAAIFISPLLYFGAIIFPHTFGKELFIYVFIDITLLLYALLIFFNPFNLPKLFYTNDSGRKKPEFLTLALTLYIITLSLATIFAKNPERSFFGTMSFNNGLLLLLHLFALYLIAKNIFNWKNAKVIFITLISSIGLLLSIISLFKFFLINHDRLGLTFGNPLYLATFLIFSIFATLLFRQYRIFRFPPYISNIAIILNILAIIFATLSRGAVLALIISGLIIGLIYLTRKKSNLIRLSALSALILLIATSATLVLVYAYKTPNFTLGRGQTIQTRLIAWKIGYRAALEKPLTGYGLENFSYPFESLYDKNFYQSPVTSAASSEHDIAFPHNKLLETVDSAGIFALIIYLAIFFYIFKILYQKFIDSQNFESLIFMGLFISYFVNNLFLFDSVTSNLLFFTFLALLSSTIYQQSPPPFENTPRQLSKMPLPLIFLFFATGSIALAVIMPARSAYFTKRSLENIVKKNYTLSMEYFNKSLTAFPPMKNDTASREVAKLLSQDINQSNNLSKVKQLYIINQIDFFEGRLADDPNFLPDYSFLAQYYLYGSAIENEYLQKSIDTSENALKMGSLRPETYLLLADAYMLQGDKNRALETGLEAIEQFDSGQTYSYFGNLLLKIKDNEQAAKYFEKAFERGYFSKNDVLNYARIQAAKKDYRSMIMPYENLVKVDTGDVETFKSLAILYKYVGDKANAKKIAEEIIRRFPQEAQNAQSFINKL